MDTTTDTAHIDAALSAWIAEKESISGSDKTRKAYWQTLQNFRARLQAQGRDLDLDLWADQNDRKAWRQAMAAMAAEIQEFSSFSYYPSKEKWRVAPNTCNARLIALSSFYRFATRRGHFDTYANPVEQIQRPKHRAYEKSRALSSSHIAVCVAKIDRTTKLGARDYALIGVGCETSRRIGELLALKWGDVELTGNLQDMTEPQDIRLLLTFRHCKGGKVLKHILSPIMSMAVLECVARCHEINPIYLNPKRPLWINLSRAAKGPMDALGYQGAQKMCMNRLGTTQWHKIRHGAAQACEALGMPLRDIQALLGHDHPDTTARYLKALNTTGENPFASTLAALFGFAPIDNQSRTMVEYVDHSPVKDAQDADGEGKA